MVFNVVILSPHGYFAQANVLGYPDTGGQVVYILDQVRALENEMLLRIKQQGLDITPCILIVTRLLPDAVGTTCGQRLEMVLDTEYTSVLRVPFRTEKGILRKWISRFEVWTYLETYADDVANELAGELQGKPDLIIGNYSDGNLVASLLAHKLGVTQIRKMDLEVRSLQPSVKVALLAKLREYKSYLDNLKAEVKRIMSANSNNATREELLESGMTNN